ncbi:MAG: 30S ribosomal protein S2 [Gammaproteobacteria bacterium]|jgi:small subunit ribosomal protein S2|nr:30S ribosomal protein S2 [Gammaproteobacteria bacterium]|tara:strand:+ start:7934 stop:8833 length:900 start_codon:yes stop_codon:yes gene_type:complete
MANISLEQLLQAGVHFGHQTKYWNPKMDQYIFGTRDKIHIINLEHTVDMIKPALKFIEGVAAKNNKILFVGTKRTATEIIKNEAVRCSMPYVNERWLGGMLTNYKTIRSSITRLENLHRQKEDGTFNKITKKEGLKIQRDIDRLEKSIGGVTEMGGLPDALFIIDVNRESIAVSEASKMGIPIVGIVDTNSNPEGIDYVIPGNDDSIRSITLFTEAVADACLEGAKAATGLKQESPQSGPSIVRKIEAEEPVDKPIEALEEKIDSSQTGVDLDGGVAEKEGILDESKKDKKEEKKTKEK